MTRFTSECDLCAELLTDYISAANEIIETKSRLHPHRNSSSHRFATVLIDSAIKRKKQARKRFVVHKQREH